MNNWKGYFLTISKPITTNITNSVFTDNGKNTDAKLVYVSGSGNGTLNVTDSIFYNNTIANVEGVVSGGRYNLNVENTVFYGNKNANYAGGALYGNGIVNVKNSYFINNVAEKDTGGAISLGGSATLTVEGSRFEGNSSNDEGGAISGWGSTNVALIKDSQFINNHNGGTYYDGGAISLSGGYIQTMDNVLFEGNVACSKGGGVYQGMNGSNTKPPILIKNTIFKDNEASTGGGYYTDGQGRKNYTYITDSEFTNNIVKATDHYMEWGIPVGGGMISAGNVPIIINNTTFTGNKADPEGNYSAGGGIYFAGESASYPIKIVDSTFTNNSALEGGAIYIQNADTSIIAQTKDVIFSGNTAGADAADYNGGADIYFDTSSYSGTLSLNAADEKKIVFNGSIAAYEDDGNTATIDINNSGVTYNTYDGTTETPVTAGNTGEVQFNARVGDETQAFSAINLYGGKLSIGQNDANNANTTNPDGYINDNNFYVKGDSILNTVNGIVGEFAPKTFDIDAALDYQFDVDLANAKSDTISVTNKNGTLNLSLFNIFSDSTTQDLKVKYSDTNVGGIIAGDYTITTSTQTYNVSALNDDTGSYVVFSQVLPLSGLPAAIYNQSNQYAITNDQDEKITAWAPDEGNIIKSDIDINGNGNSIYTEDGLDGMVVSEGKNVVIRNVEELSGFNNALTNNGETLTVTDTSVVDNTGDADITNNGGTLNINANTKDVVIGSENTTNAIVSNGGTVNIKGLDDNTVTIDGTLVASDAATINVDKDAIFNDDVTASDGSTLNVNSSATFDGDVTLSDGSTLNINSSPTFGDGTNLSVSDSTSTVNINATDKTTLSATTNNNGTINTKSDTDITGAVSGNGSIVNTASELNVNSSVEQSAFTNTSGTVTVDDSSGSITTTGKISNAGTMTSNAGNLAAEGGIVNTNILNLTGGTLDSSISGDGTTNIIGDVTVKYIHSQDPQYNKISQDIDVAKTASLNANVASIGGDITVEGDDENVGVATLYSQEESGGNLNNKISGNGKVVLNRNINVNADVAANTIEIKTYTKDDNDYNADIIVTEGKTFGASGGTITIDTDNSLTMQKADDLATAVTNNGVLKFVSGTNNNNVTGDGENVISGNVENTANIINNVTVNSDGTLNNNGGSLGGDGKTVTNNGTLSNDGNISGTTINNGTLVNDGNVEGKVVNSKDITNNLSIEGDVTNNSEGKCANNNGGSIVGNLNNKGIVDNKGNIIAGNGKSVNNSGTINNTGNLNGNINNQKQGIINTTIEGLDGEVTNHGAIHYTNSGNLSQDINGAGIVHLDGNGTTKLNANLNGNTLSLNNGTLIFGSNKDLSQGGFIGNGGSIGNILDGKTSTYKLGNAILKTDTKVDGIDFNLNNLTSDKFIAQFSGNGKLVVDKVQVQGTLTNSIKVFLGDTMNVDKQHLNVKNQKLPSIMTPIQLLSGKIEDNYLTYAGAGNSVDDFNPDIMASPVATQIGGYLTQLETLHDGFFHMERYTKYSSADRKLAENMNHYAITETPAYEKPSIPETSQAMWTKPYTTFEKVHLKGGLNVSNVAYGSLFGGDSDLITLKHDWKGVLSAFVGYNGSHQSYRGISMNHQGGTLGVTATAYKGNFFTGITASAGASAGEAYIQSGTDNFAMITSGIANKTGYNFEIKEGKLIVQPSLFLGYTFVNTFDYKNSAGVKVDSDPLNAIQIIPSIKIIGNLKNGWQPYAGVSMVWNVMDKTNVKANDVKLPQLSVKPYVQYGVGVQKSWGERFTGFFQTFIRNGGRTGVGLQLGFRWNVGGKNSNTNVNGNTSPVANKKVIKSYKKI